MLHLELAVDRAAFDTALRAGRGRGEDREILRRHVQRRIDARNAATLLALAGTRPAADAFVAGGRSLAASDFERLAGARRSPSARGWRGSSAARRRRSRRLGLPTGRSRDARAAPRAARGGGPGDLAQDQRARAARAAGASREEARIGAALDERDREDAVRLKRLRAKRARR
jgi:hypothetical protein